MVFIDRLTDGKTVDPATPGKPIRVGPGDPPPPTREPIFADDDFVQISPPPKKDGTPVADHK